MVRAAARETRRVSEPILIDDLSELRRRRSLKWDSYPDDVRPLWVAEMDCRLAEPVLACLATAVARSDTGYAPQHGPAGVAHAEAFAGFAQRHWSWPVDPALTVPVPDVMAGATHAIGALTPPGSPVVLTPPVYPPFFHRVGVGLGRPIVPVPLRAGHALDLAGIDAAFAAGARALLLCHPHNPTGAVFPAAVLAELAGIAARRGAVVVADEIHAPLVLGPRPFTPYLTVDPRAVTLHSASKAFNLPGLKAALVVAGDATAAALVAASASASVGPGLFGVLACTGAYSDGDEWLAQLLDELRANQHLLAELLADRLPAVSWSPTDATYLAWLDFRALDLGDDPAAALLDRTRVALYSGLPFGPGGAGFARLNLATGPTLLTEAVTRLAGVVTG